MSKTSDRSIMHDCFLSIRLWNRFSQETPNLAGTIVKIYIWEHHVAPDLARKSVRNHWQSKLLHNIKVQANPKGLDHSYRVSTWKSQRLKITSCLPLGDTHLFQIYRELLTWTAEPCLFNEIGKDMRPVYRSKRNNGSQRNGKSVKRGFLQK